MNDAFHHSDLYPDSSAAAALVLPRVLGVAGHFDSAIDVGGGTGAWAATLKRLGVPRVACIDDPRVLKADLLVDQSEFVGCDMSVAFPTPTSAELAMCLEFAEHIPAERSEALVRFLTAVSPVILFSAAIPGQPSPFHVNERPPEYWRTLFQAQGFRRYDCVRPLILGDSRIPYWYRQNLYLFATETEAQRRGLTSLPFAEIPEDFELVHAHVLRQYRTQKHPKVRDVPSIVSRSLRSRLGRS